MDTNRTHHDRYERRSHASGPKPTEGQSDGFDFRSENFPLANGAIRRLR